MSAALSLKLAQCNFNKMGAGLIEKLINEHTEYLIVNPPLILMKAKPKIDHGLR
jgi:hypothetical protein